MSLSIIKFLIVCILGFCFFFWIFEFFSGDEAMSIIMKHYNLIYLIIIAHIPTLAFDTLAWMFLMTKKKINFFWSLVITWVSQTAGKIMPTGNITGEFVRIYLSTKRGMNSINASSSVIADLAIATFSLLLIAFFSLTIVLLMSENSSPMGEVKYIIYGILVIIFSTGIFCYFIRVRIFKKIIKKSSKYFRVSTKKYSSIIINFLKFDYKLYKLSFDLKILFKSLIFRLLGWLGGAFEIYVFLKIINVEISILGIVLIESFSGIVRALAFFVPAAIGIQEIAFVIVGNFLGLSNPIALSIAIGRRIREISVGVPAIICWFFLFGYKSKVN